MEPSDKPKLLVVDDDENLRTQMRWVLAQDYRVFLAEGRQSALAILSQESPLIVILDLGLPPSPSGVEEGMLALAGMIEQDPLIKVIILSGRTEKEYALQAIEQGAYDFLYKPIQVDELKVILRRALYVSGIEREHRDLQRRLSGEEERNSYEGMLGVSPQMQQVFATIRKVAATDVPVLIEGESGTGKELVARAIHRQSERRGGPFVVINCGAIPETLLESELFGHEKGAFTGAHIQRKGRIEAAQGGTLFLDEIGELAPPLQVKLLRFLQERRVERVGGRGEISVDARVLAATNVDLKKAIADGCFREDLYYRLGVVTIALPPLRERGRDIHVLARAFLQRYARENKSKITGFTRQALRALETYGWPGNVRELENRIKRAVIMADGRRVTSGSLEISASPGNYTGMGLKEAREQLEREMIRHALVRSKNNLTRAAADLGISRPTLYELMEKLGIKRDKAS